MVDKFPGARDGQLIYPAGVRATAEVKATIDLKGGELLKVSDADGRLEPAGADDVAVAVLAEGQSLAAGKIANMAVYFLGNVVKVTAGGAIPRGSWVKAGANGKVVAAATNVAIPAGTTTVTSTSAQPSMTVEGGIGFGIALDSAAANGDKIRVVMR